MLDCCNHSVVLLSYLLFVSELQAAIQRSGRLPLKYHVCALFLEAFERHTTRSRSLRSPSASNTLTCRKFGKHLQKRQLDIPEYAASFVNYKALKKVFIYIDRALD